jgi:hypothetical protein
MKVGNSKSLPWSGARFKEVLALIENIRLGLNDLAGANALAYLLPFVSDEERKKFLNIEPHAPGPML